MLTLTGNGRLTRDVQLRTTHSGKTVATISVASDRRDRDAQAVYVDLVVWEAQAEAAAKHLTKGQAVSFAGRFEPREFATTAGDRRIALEVHDVAVEYGAKPRAARPSGQPTADDSGNDDSVAEDIPF
jgi:single-strand DNA-binding protein